MCIGCGEMKPKNELIRIVRDETGVVTVDRRGNAPGRGAYLCDSRSCLEKAVKRKRAEKIFKTGISAEFYRALESEMSSE